jgi:hypothetical protein
MLRKDDKRGLENFGILKNMIVSQLITNFSRSKF